MFYLPDELATSTAANPLAITNAKPDNNSGAFWGGLGDVINTTLTNAAALGGQILNLELIGEVLEEQREAGFATATTQQTAGSTANGLPAPIDSGAGWPEWLPYAGLGLAGLIALLLILRMS